MNRRDILKALAGIPLLGLLVKPIWEKLLVEEFVSRVKPMWGGKTVFVDPTLGDNANDGLSSETSVATLQKAFELTGKPWCVILKG